MEDKKLTYKQASELTGVSCGTLYTLVHQKRIPHIRLGKRFVRFSRDQIQAWLQSHEVKSRA